jgi:hypothetical protein
MRNQTLALFLGAAVLAGCADSIIKPLGPENNEQVNNEPGTFRFQAGELDNVHDTRQFTWTNPGPQAAVLHRNFIHHGTVVLMVRDAVGTLVDSIPMEYGLDTETDVGVAGTWQLELRFYGARGRVDVTLETIQTPAP